MRPQSAKPPLTDVCPHSQSPPPSPTLFSPSLPTPKCNFRGQKKSSTHCTKHFASSRLLPLLPSQNCFSFSLSGSAPTFLSSALSSCVILLVQEMPQFSVSRAHAIFATEKEGKKAGPALMHTWERWGGRKCLVCLVHTTATRGHGEHRDCWEKKRGLGTGGGGVRALKLAENTYFS